MGFIKVLLYDGRAALIAIKSIMSIYEVQAEAKISGANSGISLGPDPAGAYMIYDVRETVAELHAQIAVVTDKEARGRR